MTPDDEGAEFRAVSADEMETLLRKRVAAASPGTRERHDAHWQLVRFLAMTGRREKARTILEEMLATISEAEVRAQITLALGQNFEGQGDFAAAADTYARGIALEPVSSQTWYLLHNNLGYSLNQLGRPAEAEKWCRTAIQIDPVRHNAYKNLGIACSALGRYEEAIRCWITATDRCVKDPRALRLLGELLEAHPEIFGRFPELIPEVDRCLAAAKRALE